MGTHKDCGEEVRWARRSDDVDKWMPPLEWAGHAHIIVDNGNGEQVATEVATYRPHHCDPEKMEAWQEYKAKLEKVRAKAGGQKVILRTDWEIARERNQEIARNESIIVPCSKCNADRGTPCHNLTLSKKTGAVVPTKMPHTERWLEALKATGRTPYETE